VTTPIQELCSKFLSDRCASPKILAAVNDALAGNGLLAGYTFSTLNDLVANINLSWDNCQQSDWGAAHLSVAQP
jgi:hypothetical protein